MPSFLSDSGNTCWERQGVEACVRERVVFTNKGNKEDVLLQADP